jgi:NADPH:quinone reductase-like Zn-dependent oxidoreductase
VLVGVEFAPINFSDILVARGLYPLRPDLPSAIGNEGVGRVLEIGQQVKGLRVGARVALQTGRDWIAMNAANSSIARWIIAFAKQKGLRIVGLARRAVVLDEVRAAGCDLSLLDQDTAPSEMAEALGKVRPRLALDAIGGDASGRLAKLLGQGGTFVSYATPSFAPLAISPLDVIFNDLTIRGFALRNPAFYGADPHAIRAAAQMIAAGEVVVPIAATYPLDEIKTAVAHALQGGKVLLEVHGTLS